MCLKYDLKLYPKKWDLFTRNVFYCGRTIFLEGIKFDPRRLEVLLNM